jgi:autotransporter adhesin
MRSLTKVMAVSAIAALALAGCGRSDSGGGSSSGSGSGSVAIGEGAEAPNSDSVAIGSNSTTDRDNEISVGSPGSERVVSNVAAATRPTDAVNLQQMNDRFDTEREYTDGRFNQMDKRLDRMGAISAAYAGMATNTAGLSGDSRIGAGIGSQNGRSALAVGYQRILGDRKNISVSLGGAFSGSDKSVSAGAGFSW